MTGNDLVMRMMALLRRYVVLTEAQALVVALWALNTWVYEHFAVVPYLEIWAMHKRSGKTTLAEILAALSRGGTVLATVRTLQMVRIIEAKDGHYTAFIEEAEKFSKGSLGDERSILATGYRKGASHEITTNKGDLLRFRTFCPKAFVLIGNVHDILRDRSISIKLERGTPERNWTLERFTAESECRGILDAWQKVVSANLDVIHDDKAVRFPVVDPEWLTSDRDREIWSPLFSLASALRLHKPLLELLTRASVDLSVLKTLPAVRYSPAQDEQVGEDGNAADALLRDVRAVIGADEKAVATEDLLNRLRAIDRAPWRSWRGVGLDAIALGALLARFGLAPENVQIGRGRKDRRIVKGYKADTIRKAKTD